MTLAEAPIRARVVLRYVGGERGFRRRLMEMGLHVRGSRLSIRAAEAALVQVEALGVSEGAA